MTPVLGIHHVTAIAGDPQRNLDFYAGTLGLRFVKRTVNFDDPRTYHFYFADEFGTPGSVMTFFPWPMARRGRPGTGQVGITSFAARSGSVGFWAQRLTERGVTFEGPRRRDAAGKTEHVLSLADPDGLPLEIVGRADAELRTGWAGAAGVPDEHSLRGFHAVTLWLAQADPTTRVLDLLGMRPVAEVDGARRYAAGDGGPGTLVDVREPGDLAPGLGGAGTVHHVAWRMADDDAELEVRARVEAAGLAPTPVIDRSYFHSVYFREPGGVLFELATDGPGFAVDESPERLGEGLMLPARYEPMRAQIEAALPPIRVPGSDDPAQGAGDASAGRAASARAPDLGFVHHFSPPDADAAAGAEGAALLLLHGTGGDENDLLPLGRLLAPGVALLSPRGRVSEAGLLRFFKRVAEGVFDLQDLAIRTEELGDFVEAATRAYDLDASRLVAVAFSNGANIAASLLLRRPSLLRAAVLFSPMLPYDPEETPDLAGAHVFIGAGREDPVAPPAQVEKLAELLRVAGADVHLHWEPGGHALTRAEVDAARAWLEGRLSPRAPA
ncbi:MAG: VOC family protein [Gemmatimonadota bacterium]